VSDEPGSLVPQANLERTSYTEAVIIPGLPTARRLLAIALLFSSVCACGSPQTLRVADIQLGRSLNADNSIRESATQFTPHDSVYVSVITAGSGSGTIAVRWTLAGRVLDEPRKQVSYTDSAATDFSLQSAAGFPPGQYTAEVFLNGQSAGTRTFRIE
jgi:hypothetical protein